MTLGAPPPLSRDEVSLWNAKLKDAARAVGSTIGAMLHKEIGAEVVSPKRRRFSDLTARISELTATSIGAFGASGAAPLAVSLPLGDALKAVDMLLGGAGAPRQQTGPPTLLESAFILEFSSAIAKALSIADPNGASRWNVETLALDRETAPPLPAHETAIVIDLELSLKDGPMRIEAWIPEVWIDPIGAKAPQSRPPEGKKSLLEVKAEASARIDGGWLALGEALSLHPGDLVRLDGAEGGRLCLNGLPVFTGTLIRDMEPISFEIDSILKEDTHD